MANTDRPFPHRYETDDTDRSARSAWVWVVAGGAVLLGLGLAGLATCPVMQRTARRAVGRLPRGAPVEVTASTTVDRPPAEIFRFWREVTNLAQLLPNVESIEPLGGRLSRWTVREPGGQLIRFDSEITYEREGERIAWRARPGADVPHSGRVTFRDAPGGGTEVEIGLRYEPPAGRVGRSIAEWLGHEPRQELEEAMRRLKQILESGQTGVGA